MAEHHRMKSLRKAKIESQETTSLRKAFITELKQCGNRKDLQGGKHLHYSAVEAGLHKNIYVATALIRMYTKCSSMKDARDVFDNMLQHDVVSWTALILGYVENGESFMALEVFNSMDCIPNGFTFAAALKACSCLGSLDKKTYLQKGESIHRQAREKGFEKDVFVASTLVDMYSKCGDMLQAREVFDRMTQRDVVSWTALILGYVENGESFIALDVFNTMDCAPNRVTFVAALKACAGLVDKKSCIQKGLAVHRMAKECGFEKDLFVANTLVEMYSRCGEMSKARDVFNGMKHRDVVCWTALILGYVENRESSMALEVFNSMDCAPDSVTFVAALKACAAESCLVKGLTIHRQARERGFDKDVLVASTLVDVYVKCGEMELAKDVFDGMAHRSVVSWNVLILGYVENGESSVALDVFNSMECAPNGATFVAVLKACARLGALDMGERIHDRVRELKLEEDETVASCLVDFYGKCGNVDAARDVFNRMRLRDIVLWNALIGGYSLLGDTSEVFSLVRKLQEEDLQMDSVTMLLILTACSHGGSVEEGERYFESIVNPTLEHYTCMVDMYGKANRLQEALSLVKNMPFESDSQIWMTLLGACKKWSNVEIGKAAFLALVARSCEEHVAAAYVLMQHIYERSGMQLEGEYIVKRHTNGRVVCREVEEKLRALL